MCFRIGVCYSHANSSRAVFTRQGWLAKRLYIGQLCQQSNHTNGLAVSTFSVLLSFLNFDSKFSYKLVPGDYFAFYKMFYCMATLDTEDVSIRIGNSSLLISRYSVALLQAD